MGGSSQEVYRYGAKLQAATCVYLSGLELRLDLEAGTFLTPIEMQKLDEVNQVVTSIVGNSWSEFGPEV